MKITNKLLNSFIKDFNIPINVYEEKIFKEQLKVLGFEKEFEDFNNILSNFKDEEEYFIYRRKLQDNVINYIKNLDAYKENIISQKYDFYFGETRINKDIRFSFPFNIDKNLYTEKNLNKKYISIDIRSANFQVFRFAGVLDFFDYQSLMSKFDIFDYFYKSKNIRQIIFGNLNPKTTTTIQKHIMKSLLDTVIKTNPGLDFETIILNNDEIILSYDESIDLSFLEDTNFDFRIETFVLKDIRDKKDKLFYYKDFKDRKILYTVPKIVYIQAYKKLHNLKINEDDLLFHYEGARVKFLENQF